ncbi:MAG TPA: hypothetical protein VFA20_29265 [Myxococcaceae bacterium]|nr:hypothetical protein [Myxococcaceae bacterium]
MNPSNLVRLSAASAVLLASFACHRPTPEEIATQTAENTAALITEAGETAQSVNDMSSLDTASAGMRSVYGTPCAVSDPACAAPKAPPQDSFDAQVAQIRKFLKERIFIEENLESSDSFSATFRVPGTALCSDGTTAPDPSCVSQVDALHLRVKAMPQLGGGVNLQVFVSDDRFELMSFELGKQTLAVITDLPQTKKALDFIATTGGSTTTPTPKVLEGKLEARLTKNGDHDFTMSYGVLWGVKVAWDDASGHEMSFSTASNNPLASLRVEAPKKRVTVELNAGETKYAVPFTDVANAANPLNGQPETFFLSGLTAKLVAEEGKDVLISNLGLGGGQSSMKVGDKTAWTVDLNKDAWRHLDLKLSRDDQGRVVVSMNPELDFILGTFYSVLRQMGSVYPDTMADESLRLRISGGGTPSMTAVAADATSGFPGGWKMLSGGLTFSTDQAGFDPLVVRAGQCMVPRQSPPAAGMHPVYGAWEAVDCP